MRSFAISLIVATFLFGPCSAPTVLASAPSGLAASLPPSAAEVTATLDGTHFVRRVTNRYFPLVPGTTFIYGGQAHGVPLQDILRVTADTRVILGVTTIVVTETLAFDGRLAETSSRWYAQDTQGNVWILGCNSTQYEDGVTVGHSGSWEAGVEGARPGLAVQANPHEGDTYEEGYARGVHETRATVMRVDMGRAVPYGSFYRVLKIGEQTPLSPNAVLRKYYALNVGLILVKQTTPDESADGDLTLELVQVISSQG